MALKKEINYKGFTLDYWVIADTHWDKVSNATTIMVKGYKDKKTRDADIDNCIDDLTQYYIAEGSHTIEDLYNILKTQPIHYLDRDAAPVIPFENAEDC